jgi:hypothetical protein
MAAPLRLAEVLENISTPGRLWERFCVFLPGSTLL